MGFSQRLGGSLLVLAIGGIGTAYAAELIPDDVKENIGKIIPGANDTDEGTTAIVAAGVLATALLFAIPLLTWSKKAPSPSQ